MKIKNPMLNAAVAAVYIALVVTIMNTAGELAPMNRFIGPIAFLSLFTLSAAVMGYLFLGQPILFYLDGKKKEAITFFIQTLLTFAVLTVIFLLIAAFGAKLI